MSLIDQYRATEQALKELEGRLAEMGASERLKRELALVDKFNALVEESGFTLREALRIVNPDLPKQQPTSAALRLRAPRKVMKYTNPISGEVVLTKGGNNRVLKAWKSQYGAEKVNSWKVEEE
ncbi:MAG: DNA binding protein [Candidimonas sp.]|nr:DNA binding protein [Candidimonas sp.]